MALGGARSALSGLSDLRKEKAEEKENLWKKILGEVQSSERNKLPSCKSVLVLGDNESGKTTLIAKLQGNEDPKKGSGLEYAYIDVRDEYRDDHTRLSVWVLDGEPVHGELLEYAVNPTNLEHTLVLLTVSMTTPWAIMDQLHTWASTLQDHIDKLNLDPDHFKERQDKMSRLWQDYVEPGDELEAGSPMKRSSRNLEGEDEPVLPLAENVLTRNLGLHVIVVVTKTDYMSTLEKDYDYKEEHFDFIQQSIRKFCLQYGAALFYTSVKEDKNCDLLYKYLVHKIYNFPFRTPALVVEKDAVFIPAGWDNEKKIAILYENMHTMTPEDYYTDVIVRPPVVRKAVAREVEVQAEDEQAFLARHLSQLQAGGSGAPHPPQGRQESPLRQSPAVQKTSDRRVSTGVPANQIGSPKKIETNKPGGQGPSEGVLANFFNSLLSKKTATNSPPPGAIKANVYGEEPTWTSLH
ncbi:cytoplasmic dynein 1 light intermediate chain 2-like isoform X3 [Eriocheir sinensis]|uniref:cytoplasmic dynein 1 light intermediate chain 2-like isoform X3 n=1 Tax=Eriocheir sinensis TaxID=95602 RepID=UPI0021C703EE|nr:cytoplasmic dynein 1 light intermediate chain 2-like isoform X3 [Eriocheir sinensis]XP_050689113.1 cytoplasmic dynein 1 light intermediate chain 2-like isoform X3 [Eriocheir sinensis]